MILGMHRVMVFYEWKLLAPSSFVKIDTFATLYSTMVFEFLLVDIFIS
jgi:hypothetical protein